MQEDRKDIVIGDGGQRPTTVYLIYFALLWKKHRKLSLRSFGNINFGYSQKCFLRIYRKIDLGIVYHHRCLL